MNITVKSNEKDTVWVCFEDSQVEVRVVDGNLVVHALHAQANHDGRNMFTIQQDGTVVPFKGEE